MNLKGIAIVFTWKVNVQIILASGVLSVFLPMFLQNVVDGRHLSDWRKLTDMG